MNFPTDRLDVQSDYGNAEKKLTPKKTGMGLSLKDVIADVVRLKEILREETAHMRSFNMKPVREVHEEKMQLIKKLELQKKLIKHNPALLGDKTPQEVENFKVITADMEDLLMSNYLEALKAKEVNERVVQIVSKAVMRESQESAGYSSNGYAKSTVVSRGGDVSSQNNSLAINQTI